MLTRAGEREQVKVHAQKRPSESIRVCVQTCASFKAADASVWDAVWVTLPKQTENAISSWGITITKTTRRIRGVLVGCACVHRRLARYIPGDLRICIPTSGHPAKPMYAFSYLAPNKPFLRADSRRDGYGLGTLDEQTVPWATPFSIRSCKLLPLIASAWHDDGNSGHPT